MDTQHHNKRFLCHRHIPVPPRFYLDSCAHGEWCGAPEIQPESEKEIRSRSHAHIVQRLSLPVVPLVNRHPSRQQDRELLWDITFLNVFLPAFVGLQKGFLLHEVVEVQQFQIVTIHVEHLVPQVVQIIIKPVPRVDQATRCTSMVKLT